MSQITGALLVFALLVMPAAAAQQLTARPVFGTALTVVLGLLVTWLSLAVAFYSPWPVGFFVSTFGFAVYVAAAVGRQVATRLRSARRRTPAVPRSGPEGVVGA